jgi:hypothetical protein
MNKNKLKELKRELRKVLEEICLDDLALDSFEEELGESIETADEIVPDEDRPPTEEEILDYIDEAIQIWSREIGERLTDEIHGQLRWATKKMRPPRTVEHHELHGDNDPELAFA